VSNTLTVLIPTIVASLQRVLRQTGHVLNLATVDASMEAAGLNQTINLPATAAAAVGDVSPGVVPPAAVDNTPTAETLTLTRHKYSRFHVTAEEWKALAARGPDFRSRAIEECIAALINDTAVYAAGLLDAAAGYAIGAQGTGPFASDATLVVDADKILNDALAPQDGRVFGANTTDWAAIKKLASYMKTNEAPRGTDFASGQLGQLGGFVTGFDQSITTHATSTATDYAMNGAGAIGDKTLTVDTGTGSWVAGDVLHATGDTANKYVVRSATATVITLNAPLKAAIADNVVLVKQAAHRVNFAVNRDALVLGIRPSAEMPDGDAAAQSVIVGDPVTGIGLRLAQYKGYHLNQWELSIVSGGAVRPLRRNQIVKIIG